MPCAYGNRAVKSQTLLFPWSVAWAIRMSNAGSSVTYWSARMHCSFWALQGTRVIRPESLWSGTKISLHQKTCAESDVLDVLDNPAQYHSQNRAFPVRPWYKLKFESVQKNYFILNCLKKVGFVFFSLFHLADWQQERLIIKRVLYEII